MFSDKFTQSTPFQNMASQYNLWRPWKQNKNPVQDKNKISEQLSMKFRKL